MDKPTHTIMVCGSFRAAGEAQGICHKKGSHGLLGYLEQELADRGLNALVAATTCLKLCDHGPMLVVQPQDWWFGPVDNEQAIDDILDGLEDGEPFAALRLA